MRFQNPCISQETIFSFQHWHVKLLSRRKEYAYFGHIHCSNRSYFITETLIFTRLVNKWRQIFDCHFTFYFYLYSFSKTSWALSVVHFSVYVCNFRSLSVQFCWLTKCQTNTIQKKNQKEGRKLTIYK